MAAARAWEANAESVTPRERNTLGRFISMIVGAGFPGIWSELTMA